MGIYKEIAIQQVQSIEVIKRYFEMHVDREKLENYRLPVNDPETTVVVGMSGGADSTILALFVAAYLEPYYSNIRYVFTDTGAEPESCAETLDKVESLINQHIERLQPEYTLFELIDKYNGFLPSGQARYCTKSLKIEPLKKFMSTLPGKHGFISLAGIRFDEADRDGITFQYSMEAGSRAAFPFVDLGITKTMVFDVLDRSIGIPSTYKYRSRSGCYCCFFQKASEIIPMLENAPQNYARTESYEKLTDTDHQRWDAIPQTLSEAGFPAAYPVPAFIDLRKSQKVPENQPFKAKQNKVDAQDDLFGFEASDEAVYDDLFIAFALYSDERLTQFGKGREFTPATYWQELITLSTSLTGIRNALNNHYSFKRTTPQPHYDVDDMQIVIAQIRFPAGTVDAAAPSPDSYTWKSQTAYKQLRHLVRHCQVVLQKADLLRRYEDAVSIQANSEDALALMDASEQAEDLCKMIVTLPEVSGELVWEGLFTPSLKTQKQVQLQLDGVSVQTERKVVREDLEHDEVPMACLACSV